jgi:hypothetical protein
MQSGCQVKLTAAFFLIHHVTHRPAGFGKNLLELRQPSGRFV